MCAADAESARAIASCHRSDVTRGAKAGTEASISLNLSDARAKNPCREKVKLARMDRDKQHICCIASCLKQQGNKFSTGNGVRPGKRLVTGIDRQ